MSSTRLCVRRSETPMQFEAKWAGKARLPSQGRSCSESHPGSAASPVTTQPSFRAGPSGRLGRLAFRTPARGGSNPARPYVGRLIAFGRFTSPRRALCSTPPSTRTTRPPRPDAAGRSSRQDGTGFTKPDRNARVRCGGAKTGDNRGDGDPAPTPSATGNSPSTTIQPASSRRMKMAIGAAGQGIAFGTSAGVLAATGIGGPLFLFFGPGSAGGFGGTSSDPGAKPHAGDPAAGPPCGRSRWAKERDWSVGGRRLRPQEGRLRRLGAPRGRQAVGRRGKGWPKWFLRKTRVACYCGLYGRNRPAPNEAGRRYGRIRPPPRAELRSVSRLRAVAGPPARDEPSSGVPPVRLFYQPRLMDASSSNARKGFSRKNVSRSP